MFLVNPEIIENSLAQAKNDYSETQIVSQLAQQRLSRIKGVAPLKAKARLYGYLLRRGFSPEVVGEVLRTILGNRNGPL